MMSSSRNAASRYTSFDSQSSSIDLKLNSRTTDSAIVRVNSTNQLNFASMVKKFMDKRSSSNSKSSSDRKLQLIIPPDLIAEDSKKTARKGSNFAAIPKKLFGKGASAEKKTKGALMEVNYNTRTLAMVLRSERELLTLNKQRDIQIAELSSLLQERNKEVEKLKDLCLKQREEIKALKSAILFPDEMNSQLHVILDKQGSELKQAKQVIPTLQRQISSLTGQLQSLSEDVAEVKAVKYSGRSCIDGSFSSPRTLLYDQEQAANCLDFNSDDDPASPGSPDMLLEDMNPCLTPCYSKIKSKEYKAWSYGNANYEKKASKSSDSFTNFRAGRAFCRSDDTKCRYGNRTEHQVL